MQKQQTNALIVDYAEVPDNVPLSADTLEAQMALYYIGTKLIWVGNLSGRKENRLVHRDTIRKLMTSVSENGALPITNITM